MSEAYIRFTETLSLDAKCQHCGDVKSLFENGATQTSLLLALADNGWLFIKHRKTAPSVICPACIAKHEAAAKVKEEAIAKLRDDLKAAKAALGDAVGKKPAVQTEVESNG